MISIFAKPAFLNVNPNEAFKDRTKPVRSGHLMRVSSMIRGDQIAEAIGAKLNPESGYEDDVCIYVKPHVRKKNDFSFEGKKAYLDIIDGHNLGDLALKHPEVTVIVCSKVDYVTMSKAIPNKIILIPQHHCNFERLERKSKKIRSVGVIGTKHAFPHLPKGLREALKERNIELVEFSKFFSRTDIIKFYMSIDLQIVWRPYKKLLSNPLKIVNAASFGIPTIALSEPAFHELEGNYLGINTPYELLSELDYLIEKPRIYSTRSWFCIKLAEKYHIDNIAKLYKELDR
jgi:hypothetical protein|tara:strand:- start:291 stop:1154 length:864 start_codon:yes stop_codon:yes gene_type:complete